MPTDAQLLQRYLDTRAEADLAAVVERFLPLVLGTALRQVGGDSHRAREAAQSVFLLFAQRAADLRRHPSPVGWLHTTTRNVASKLMRAERRRAKHERDAAEEAAREAAASEGAVVHTDWERLRPVIDEALQALREEDRTAVLLRFFCRRSYGEIACQLGLGENAARMRVDRALERLRGFLSRRGIASTGAALSLALSAHASPALPVGLAASIAAQTSAALATASVGASGGGGLLFLMSTHLAKKAALVVALGTAATGLFLQHRAIDRLDAENAALSAEIAALRKATPRPYVYKAPAADAVAPLEAELARLRAQVEQMKSGPAHTWQERVGQLRDLLARMPELGIPELQLATEEDWLDAAKEKLETADDYRRALGKLRNLATARFSALAYEALQAFLKANPGQQPANSTQLQAYLSRTLDPAILERYAVKPASSVPNMVMGADWIVTQKSAVDEDFDSQVVIGPRGMGTTSWGVGALRTVHDAYRKANPGQRYSDPAQLLPYATTPEQTAAVQRQIRNAQRSGK